MLSNLVLSLAIISPASNAVAPVSVTSLPVDDVITNCNVLFVPVDKSVTPVDAPTADKTSFTALTKLVLFVVFKACKSVAFPFTSVLIALSSVAALTAKFCILVSKLVVLY